MVRPMKEKDNNVEAEKDNMAVKADNDVGKGHSIEAVAANSEAAEATADNDEAEAHHPDEEEENDREAEMDSKVSSGVLCHGTGNQRGRRSTMMNVNIGSPFPMMNNLGRVQEKKTARQPR